MRIGFDSYIGSTEAYKEQPRIFDSEEMEKAVEKLRNGDMSVTNYIIMAHLRLTMTKVSQLAPRHEVDDLVSEALLTLTERVHKAATYLHDNNITPYLMAAITGKIMNARNKPICGVSKSTYRRRKGQIEIAQESMNFDTVSKAESNTIEIEEVLFKITYNKRDRELIGLLAEGYTYDEIAPILKLSESRVCQLKQNLEKRFDELSKQWAC